MNYFVKPIHNIIWNKNIVDFTKFLQINSVFFIELALVALQIMAKTESEEDALVLSAFDSLIEALKENPILFADCFRCCHNVFLCENDIILTPKTSQKKSLNFNV